MGSTIRAKQFGRLIGIMTAICAMYGCFYAAIVFPQLSQAARFIPGYLTFADGIIIGIGCGSTVLGLAFFGRSGMKAVTANPRSFIGCVLISIFIEAIALYCFIVALSHMATAQKKQLDLAAGTSVEFAFGMVAATIGAVVGSAVCGIAIAEASVESPQYMMRSMIAVVLNGVTAMYGLLSAIIAGNKMPQVAGAGYLAGVCYLLSSAGLSYFGYYGIQATASFGAPDTLEEPALEGEIRSRSAASSQSKAFISMMMKLIGSQSIALLGLIINLIASTRVHDEAHPDQQFCVAHGNYYNDGRCYSRMRLIFLAQQGLGPAQYWAFAAAFLAVCLPTAAVLLGNRKRNGRIQEPLLA